MYYILFQLDYPLTKHRKERIKIFPYSRRRQKHINSLKTDIQQSYEKEDRFPWSHKKRKSDKRRKRQRRRNRNKYIKVKL